MIERIRKRFIHVTILSVLVALLLIMGTFNFVAFRSVQTNADLILDLMANNGGFPGPHPGRVQGHHRRLRQCRGLYGRRF